MSEWQPIETAPKDGSSIILSNGTSVAQGWWEHQEPYVREKRDMEGNYIDQDEHDGYDGWLDFDGGMLPEPTHWMPLPPPPGTLGAKVDLTPWEKARFGVFHPDGRFEELSGDGPWEDHPLVHTARWVGGIHDMQVLRAALSSNIKEEKNG